MRSDGRSAADEVADNVFGSPITAQLDMGWHGRHGARPPHLEVIEAEGLFERAVQHGLRVELAADFRQWFSDPGGRGLMCAFSLPTDRKDELIRQLWQRVVIVLPWLVTS